MKKFIAVVFSTLFLVVGCTDKEEDKKNELQQDQTQASKKETNKELTEQLKNEKGVQDAQVYEQNGVATAIFELDEKVSDQEATSLAKKYAETLKNTYKNSEVKVNAMKGDKTVATVEDKAPTKPNNTAENNKTVSVQSLIDDGIVTFIPNPLTEQINVIIDSTKLTGDLANKKNNELQLVVNKETSTFQTNKFKPELFEIINTDYTEIQLKSAKIQVK